MFNNKNFEYDCTSKCRLKAHGNAITAALTKRSIQDDKLVAYIAKICNNFTDNVDDLGRSAVHVAASVDRYHILEWLLKQGAIINAHDYESGNTPLHRAIFYGCINCAVLLLRYGASLESLDEDHRTPLQYVCRLCDVFAKQNNCYSNELLVWGLNKNYNLGISNDVVHHEDVPQMLDYFRKEQINLKSVALGAYHSIFLDKKGQVYTVGHGKGGRLGFGNEDSVIIPRKVNLKLKNQPEEVISISVSRKHSLLLTKNSLVYACGLNDFKQLGVKNQVDKLLTFKEIITLRDLGVKGLIRILACDYCSVTYSTDCIYVWGTNVGQMGFAMDKKVILLPTMMKLPPKTKIVMVEVNNAAIVVLTQDNQILIFHNYKMKILKAPNYECLKSVTVMESNIASAEKGTASALKLLILTQTNVAFLWYQLTRNFYRCSFTPPLKQINKILYKRNQVLILSRGDVYRGKFQQVPMPSYPKNEDTKLPRDLSNIWNCNGNRSIEISKDFMMHIDLCIIQNIDRVINIYCDDNFSSFAVLQESHMKYFKLPIIATERYTFKNLYNDTTECDNVHDIIFHVDGMKYPAHKFIIFSRSSVLAQIITKCQNKDKGKNIYLNYPRLTNKMFEIIMKFIYTNYLPNEEVLLADLKEIQSSMNPDERPENILEVLQWVLHYVELFQLNEFTIYLKSYYNDKHLKINKGKLRFKPLHHTDHPELFDLCLICEGNIELNVHKCVLVERLEYFQRMFTHTWHEKSVVHLTTIPYQYMLCIIEFLYSMDVLQFRKKSYSEPFLYYMIIYCDQFFIEQLREICETLLLEKITIRKCGEMLDFACTYNCNRLKAGCLDYICQNIARVLFQNSLRNCDPLTLQVINVHYRNMFKHIFDYRVITPDTTAIDDECLLSYVEGFHIDFDSKICEKGTDKTRLIKQKGKNNKTMCLNPASERQYEREAVSSMMANLNIVAKQEQEQQQQKVEKLAENDTSNDTLDLDVPSTSQQWLKVTEKKDHKKKCINVEQILNIHDKLHKEEKCNEKFINLREILAGNDEKTEKSFQVNLADLTVTAIEKLTQKQRKRLLSDGNSGRPLEIPSIEMNTSSASCSTPLHSPRSSSKSDLTDYDKSPSILERSSFTNSTSFANMMRVSPRDISSSMNNKSPNLIIALSPPTSTTISESKISNNFSEILANERRQRDNYERMRHKSLTLTQIEEQAISELKGFYNAEHINDEIITIERKPQPQDNRISFATWQKN